MRSIVTSLLIFFISSFCQAQNVGIGTNAPTQKLDVNGTIRIRQGNPGEGKVLSSDANGNASWQRMEALSGQSVGFGSWGDCSMNSISEYNPVTDPAGADYSQLGHSVFISGSFAIVGARHDDAGSANPNNDMGAAIVFEFNGRNWVFKQRLTDPTAATGDMFGTSVAIYGDLAIVGAPGDDVGANTDQGSACVFRYDGSDWIFLQKLTDNTGAAGDNFGTSVYLYGSFVMIGAPGDDVGANNSQGSAIYYKYDGSVCTQAQKLTEAAGTANDLFGCALSVSGNRVVIGASGDDTGKGAAFIFEHNGSSWVLMQRISNPISPLANDFFGASVTISGDDVFVGVPGDDNSFNGQGLVCHFIYAGTNWLFEDRMTDRLGAGEEDGYGNSVFLSGNYLIVGMSNDDVGTESSQGAALIYQRVGNGWQRLQYVHDPGGETSERFGTSVSIDGATGRFVVGVPIYGDASGKAVFGKLR